MKQGFIYCIFAAALFQINCEILAINNLHIKKGAHASHFKHTHIQYIYCIKYMTI